MLHQDSYCLNLTEEEDINYFHFGGDQNAVFFCPDLGLGLGLGMDFDF